MKHGYNNSNIVIHLTTKKLLIVILSLQLAFLGLVGFEKLGLEIPILRQAVGFIYLTFVPGFLIFKLLRINNKNAIESLLYSVGLSFFFLMFTGALINFLYPLIGISKPISEIPLIITISITVLLLGFLCYLRNNYSTTFSINKKQLFSPFVLSLSLLPFLAVFGAYLLNFYGNNTLILLLLVITSVVPLLVVFDKIPEEMYPLIILIAPFVLLSYNTLVGNYIHVSDAVFEFYFGKLVIKNCFWNKAIPSNLNAMLSVVMIPPIFSKMLDISLTWVYKIVAPLLSLFIPLGLYQIYQKRWSKKISFFASFLFFSFFTFFTWCAITMKMLFAGIFLMLLVLLITDREIKLTKKVILSIVFSFSLITSHYGTSYIFMFSLFIALILLLLSKVAGKSTRRSLTTPAFVALYSVLALDWYMFISSGSNFNTIVNLGSHIFERIQEFYLPESTAGLLMGEWAITPQILRVLYLIITFFMGIGLLIELYKTREFDEFSSLAFPFFGFLFINYGLVGYYGGRIWYIISILLAPYCIAGMLNITNFLADLKKCWKSLGKITHTPHHSTKDHINNQKVGFAIISIFLLIFLLFNSGFASEVIFKDYGPAIYLSKERISKHGSDIEKERLYRKYITDYDAFSAKWLSKKKDTTIRWIYSDQRGRDVLYPYGNISPLTPVIRLTNHTDLYSPCYIHLRYVNVVEGIISYYAHSSIFFNASEIYPLINTSNKIYTNSGSEIYYC